MDKKFKAEWCYNEVQHGKDLMNAIGSTIKNKAFRVVKSGKVNIKGAKSFAEYADLITSNHCIFRVSLGKRCL